MSTPQVATPSTQYAMKKRKRPQPRNKNSTTPAPVKSNPSKRHRDRLNTELDRLSQLIPLPTDVVNKLDKLSILRLSVAYLRNKSYSKHIELEEKNDNQAILPGNRSQSKPAGEFSESEMALQALDGFIMIITQDFTVFYITSNVQDCLGFPQSDVMYQSMLDLIHAEDRKQFMKQMLLNPMGAVPDNPPEEGDPPAVPDYVNHGLTPDMVKQLSKDGFLHRSFICRLRCLHDTSSGFLALHFTGHLGLVPGQNRHSENGTPLPPELGLFLLASPLQTPSILEIRTKNYIFRTKHKLDYTPLGIDQKGRIVLGYTEQELRQQSGYQFIHSADMMHCADAHTRLMRKGQSGLTVFRLLHRANRWQWVTASARLIYAKGIPDYIISTHRPITEQEGEEHLKKRSIAFRFDFTGHASLYASVNPIGAGPPPSNNNGSYDSPPEPKPHLSKRPRISNGVHQVDPATLFGAQSFQSMDNYPEGLPILKPSTESPPNVPYTDPSGMIKSERPFQAVDDMGSYFKQSPGSMGHDSPLFANSVGSEPEYKMTSPRSDNADSGFSDLDYQSSPGYNQLLEHLRESEAPPLHHPPISEIDVKEFSDYHPQVNGHVNHQPRPQMPAGNIYTQGTPPQADHGQNWGQAHNHQSHGHVQSQIQGVVMNGVGNNQEVPRTHRVNPPYPSQHSAPIYSQNPQMIQQPYQQTLTGQGVPYQSPSNQQPQTGQGVPYQSPSNQQPQTGQSVPYQNPSNQQIMRNPNTMYQQQPPGQYAANQQRGQSSTYGNQPHPGHMFAEQIKTRYNPGMNDYQDRWTTTSLPKENVSILNALEISSTIGKSNDDQQQKEMEEMIAMLGPTGNPAVSSDQFEISLECQEHTIQFDMAKIAADYQTANPYGVIQDFVQNNPTDAIAIATGTMPERRINAMPGNMPVKTRQSDPLPSGQFNPQRGHNMYMNQGYPQQQQQHQQYHQTQMTMNHQPGMIPQPMVKSEESIGSELPDINLEDLLTFDIPNICE